jgi:ribose transport system ATP-binding protein
MHSLSLIGLSKAYGGVPALRDVTLHLTAGRVHALMGENGAGKSTLIKLIAGVVAADSIEVRRDSAPLPLRSASDATAAGFRFIHQELNIVPQLSVAENILLGHPSPRRLGVLVDWPRLQDKARAALRFLGAEHIDVTRQAGDLGTGDRMLMRIASALVVAEGQAPPCLYVLDEPTAALTAPESAKLFAVMARLTEQGAAVLYVSHRMEEVVAVCDDVTVLRDGAHVMTAPIAQTSQVAIIEAMTGRALADDTPSFATAPHSEVACAAAGVSAGRLREISFSLKAGEVLGLVGLEQSGQSDLLRLMLGMVRVRSGQLTVLGGPVPCSPVDAWARGVAYVPRERRAEGLMLGMDVRSNSLLPHLGDYGLIARKRREASRTRDLAERVHLRYRDTAQSVQELSGGNQQKVVFARAIAGNPRLLLLEEPTRGVDVGARAEIHALIRGLSAQGCAVILASSDLPELLGLSNRFLILQDGRQAALIDRQRLTPDQLLARVYSQSPA